MIGLLLIHTIFDIIVFSYRKVFTRVNSFEEYQSPYDRLHIKWVTFFSIQGGALLRIMLLLFIFYY
ncbi:hypothetical protein SAMN04487943_11829 [Gracilibacillus orientalis]|uniref:Uncharacterized protein n=1 Tax=Gracilibacillus orientalis TaxID=334253 RepID=A0A1I4QUA9_9BACI|nr:hypothetical protein SAMN04487943_11829 [Gracilibacillus orientalis]